MRLVNSFLLVSLFFSTVIVQSTDEYEEQECIKPAFSLAIPKNIPFEINDVNKEVIYPNENWQNIAEIPSKYSKDYDFTGFIYSYGRIWVVTKPGETSDKSILYPSILSYSQIKKEWNEFQDISLFPPNSKLTLVSNYAGEIYGVVYYSSGVKIVKYDVVLDQFDFQSKIETTGIQPTSSKYAYKPIIDKLGKIWLIIYSSNQTVELYRYDPLEKKFSSMLPKQIEDIESIAVSQNNDLWMIAKINNSDWTLYQLDPNNETLTRINSDVTNTDFVFFDRESNIWISDRYWREVNNDVELGIKYEIIRSPVFTTNHGLTEDKNLWLRPIDMFQSSDGTYWFTSLAGTVKLDKENASWCLFTTGTSRVIEDDQKYVWVIINNVLFKKKLGV